MREVCCEEALKKTFSGLPGQVMSEYKEYMGIKVKMGEALASSSFQVLFLAGCAILAFIIIIIVQKQKSVSDC